MTVVNEVHSDLADALADLRGCPAWEAKRLADGLLDHDAFNRELIGVDPAGDRALYYDRMLRSVRAIPIDQPGFDGLASPEIHRIADGTEADAFVADRGAWGWLHPRYRWCAEEANRPSDPRPRSD